MDSKKQILVEQVLFTAISAFHDLDNKDKITKYARDYFSGFCERYDVDGQEAYEILEEMFEHRRTHTIFEYEYYKDGALSEILLGKEQEKDVKPKIKSDKTLDER